MTFSDKVYKQHESDHLELCGEVDESVPKEVNARSARIQECAPPPIVVLIAQLKVAENNRDLSAPGHAHLELSWQRRRRTGEQIDVLQVLHMYTREDGLVSACEKKGMSARA